MSRPEFAAVPHERSTGCGLPIGDLHGFGRVAADASLMQLTFDRQAASLRATRAGEPLLRLHVDGAGDWVGAYVPGTNVLESTVSTPNGELRVVDFMPLAEARPGQVAVRVAGRFVRIVTCTEGEITFDLSCTADVDPARIACSRPLTRVDGAASVSVTLPAGETLAFVLGETGQAGGASLVAQALHALGDTIHYWTWWSDRCRYKGDDFDVVLREALGLKLACSVAGLMLEQPGGHGFAVAPLGDMSRAAARMLDLGYRQECAELLACVYAHGPSVAHGRWSYDERFVETLDRYVAKYGAAQLPESLRAAIDVPPQSLAS